MTADEQPVKKRSRTIYGVVALALFILLVMAGLDGSGPHLVVARSAKASSQASLIGVGCQAYETEYGTLPPTLENHRLIKILCGDNPHKIEFLSLKPSDISPNGEMIDPWGTPFRITFDSDSKVLVISAGPDKIFGTPDDITNQ